MERELLPLPEPVAVAEELEFGTIYAYERSHMQAYARANIAPLQAENERLRAEVERLTFEMGCLQQQYDERTAYMIVHRGAALVCSDSVRAAYSDEHERAERLAEALRIAEAALADIGDADREPGDDLAWCEARAAQSLPQVRAALQEGT